MEQRSLERFAWISIAAALATIALKSGAYIVTASIGLLSDALESLVNLAAAIVALSMLKIAARPADENHHYGHDKAEYFSSVFEGAMILVAAIAIGVTAVKRFIHPRELMAVEIGLAISVVASLINYAVAKILFHAGTKHNSITLTADAHHLMTDVWTSVGVVVGVAATRITGWQRLDPIIAIVVAGNIVRTGFGLVRHSILGLMDTALPQEEIAIVRQILESYKQNEGIDFHALRTRRAASRRFVSVHILVPGIWSVQRGHDLLEKIEADLRGRLQRVTITTHLEPIEDPVSFKDTDLDRRL